MPNSTDAGRPQPDAPTRRAVGPSEQPSQPEPLFDGALEQFRQPHFQGGWALYSGTLDDLRRALDVTQVELAERLGVNQPAVSKVERGDDPRLSTVRKYLEALGAQLRLTAVLPDGTEYPLRFGAST